MQYEGPKKSLILTNKYPFEGDRNKESHLIKIAIIVVYLRVCEIYIYIYI